MTSRCSGHAGFFPKLPLQPGQIRLYMTVFRDIIGSSSNRRVQEAESSAHPLLENLRPRRTAQFDNFTCILSACVTLCPRDIPPDRTHTLYKSYRSTRGTFICNRRKHNRDNGSAGLFAASDHESPYSFRSFFTYTSLRDIDQNS